MAAFLEIGGRSSEPVDQEAGETLFSADPVVVRVHGTEQVIGLHFLVEDVDEVPEGFFSEG